MPRISDIYTCITNCSQQLKLSRVRIQMSHTDLPRKNRQIDKLYIVFYLAINIPVHFSTLFALLKRLNSLTYQYVTVYQIILEEKPIGSLVHITTQLFVTSVRIAFRASPISLNRFRRKSDRLRRKVAFFFSTLNPAEDMAATSITSMILLCDVFAETSLNMTASIALAVFMPCNKDETLK